MQLAIELILKLVKAIDCQLGVLFLHVSDPMDQVKDSTDMYSKFERHSFEGV
jgi:hypothetical protein